LSLFRGVLLLSGLVLFTSMAGAEVHVPVGDEREVYELLDRLDAEGAIRSGLLSTRPVSRKEVLRLIREAEESKEAERPEIRSLIDGLRERFDDESGEVSYLKPVSRISAKYLFTDSPLQILDYNNDGDIYREGSNFRLKANTRGRLSFFSYSVTPEGRISGGDKVLTAREAYVTLDLWKLEIMAGREPMWWGPGRHGSLLLSNNMEPLTMLRLTNPQPALLPWIFRYLGPFRFVFFVSRLEDDRKDVPEPILWGLRVNFRPHPFAEIGMERTAIFGGEGRSDSLSTFFKTFTGQRETPEGTPEGNQLISFDGKFHLPFPIQPVTLYTQIGAEDQSRPGVPSRWAYIIGVYLPRIHKIQALDFRAEFANNHQPRIANFWYNHVVYTQGYTYKGRVIGHHMGTDSRDLFIELSYRLPVYDSRIAVHYDREEHNLSGDIREEKNEFGIRWRRNVSKGLGAEIAYFYGGIENPGNSPRLSETIHRWEVWGTYRF
jgi:hypothetical protein